MVFVNLGLLWWWPCAKKHHFALLLRESDNGKVRASPFGCACLRLATARSRNAAFSPFCAILFRDAAFSELPELCVTFL